jgi:hypothetical protein
MSLAEVGATPASLGLAARSSEVQLATTEAKPHKTTNAAHQRIRLPIAHPRSDRAYHPYRPEPSMSATILVVDDDPDIQEMLEVVITDAGFETISRLKSSRRAACDTTAS